MSDEMSGMAITLEMMRERRDAYNTRAELCMDALDGLTNEQVGMLTPMLNAIREYNADPQKSTEEAKEQHWDAILDGARNTRRAIILE